MKASELRIGNLVKPLNPRHSEQWVTIESISIDSINVDFRAYGLSEIEPIPLTEEWLLKFGANINKWNRTNYYHLHPLTVVLWSNSNKLKSVSFRGLRVPDVCYVHQLQNLYFALTGEELTIKE